MYEHDMSNEKAPVRKRLLPEGWRKFKIVECEESQSKAGNDMFIISLVDDETQYLDKVYAIATPGKRWFLKCILTACGVEAAKDGIYKWNSEEIIDKEILGLVEHEPNKYINRDGETVETTQHRVVDFKICEDTTWGEEEEPKKK